MMKRSLLVTGLLAACLFLAAIAFARKEETPRAWVYARASSVSIFPRAGETKASAKRGELEPGSLAGLLEEKRARRESWWKVRTVDPASLLPVEGWAQASSLTQIPYDRFPADSDLLTKMGQPFMEDFVASHTFIARFLVHDGNGDTLLLCYVGSRVLPHARLQVFRKSDGAWSAGAHIEFPYLEMNSPVTKIEIRDLLGAHHDCVITTEATQAPTGGTLTRLVIRSITGDSFKTLWEAPIRLSALESYPAAVEVLSPPARNIGRPGTVTTGSVTFQPEGGIDLPVWKGKVEFFVLGRQDPVQNVPFRKVCHWTGAGFEPLR